MSEATTEDPTWAEAIQQILLEFKDGLHTSLPGKVLQFDAQRQTADIEVQVMDATDEVRSFPTLPRVPIMFPRMGAYAITFPVSAGDTGLVVFTTHEIGTWRGAGGVVAPADARRLTIAGAVFIPGLVPSSKAFLTVDSGAIVLGKPGPSADFVAQATKVLTQLTNIVNAFNTHTHPAPGGATSAPTVPMPSASSVAASDVKVT